MRRLNWCCFVSQTGKEVYDICNLYGIAPKLLVTNNPRKLKQEVLEFLKEQGCTFKVIPFRPELDYYLQEDILNSDIVTLHGYLRILPEEFISRYDFRIYNGHPGLITAYPELKGKDPQVRAWEGKYENVGSVVHEVTKEVDEGQILYVATRKNTATTLDDMYNLLRDTSLEAWGKFFKDRVG